MTADQIIKNNKVAYCDEAMFYDEQPIDLKTMFKQKERWSKGCYMVAGTRLGKLVKKLFSFKDRKNKLSTFDIAVNIFPLTIFAIFAFIVFTILSLFEPLFLEITVGQVIMVLLPIIIETFFILYTVIIISPIFTFIFERKRLPKISLFKKIAVTFYYPIFKIYELLISIEVFFKRNVGWQQIKHANETSIEDIKNGKVKISKKEAKVSVFTKVKNKALNVETADLQEDAVNIKNSH